MKVIDSVWFTPMGGACIGIVMAETDHDGMCFYIGTGAGHNQQNDEQRVLKTGAHFPWYVGIELFGKPIKTKEGTK